MALSNAEKQKAFRVRRAELLNDLSALCDRQHRIIQNLLFLLSKVDISVDLKEIV